MILSILKRSKSKKTSNSIFKAIYGRKYDSSTDKSKRDKVGLALKRLNDNGDVLRRRSESGGFEYWILRSDESRKPYRKRTSFQEMVNNAFLCYPWNSLTALIFTNLLSVDHVQERILKTRVTSTLR